MVTEHRIYGPPGTGKTTALVRWIERAVVAFSGQVGVLSFTRTAALEIAGRVAVAGVDIDPRRVGTIHSVALRALGKTTIVDGTGADAARLRKLWNDGRDSIWSIQTTIGEDGERRPGGAVWAAYVAARNRLDDAEAMAGQGLGPIDAAWRKFEAENDCTDFTGLVEQVVTTRAPLPWPAAVVFLDEAQDSTALELAAVRMWAEGSQHLVLAGDDQQAIYGFRGATPSGFLRPDLPPEQKTYLRQSYRLPEAVRAYAAAYGSTMREYEPKEFAAAAPGGDVELCRLRSSSPEQVAEEAQRMAKDGSVMILASCSYMLTKTLRALVRRGVPFHNPYRPAAAAWNPLARAPVRAVAAFVAMAEGKGTWGEATTWLPFVRVDAAGWQRGAKARIAEYADETPDEVVTPADWETVTGTSLPAAKDAAGWFLQSATGDPWLLYGALVVGAPPPAVIVGTIHSVKGGEADAVLLVPDLSEALDATEGQGSDAAKRLMYVGMTRARRAVRVLVPSSSIYDRALFSPQIRASIGAART